MFPNSSEILTESLLLEVLLKSWNPYILFCLMLKSKIIHVFWLYIYNKPRHTQTIFIFSFRFGPQLAGIRVFPVSIRRVRLDRLEISKLSADIFAIQ